MANSDWKVSISTPWTVWAQGVAGHQRSSPPEADRITVTGCAGAEGVKLNVAPPELVSVEGEACPSLPLFAPEAAGWARGQRLFRVQSQETSVKGGLEPGSLAVTPTNAACGYSLMR
ncbi:MAG: hypothetical protein HN700_07385 [Verrucomicrobia bacterium]|nr:hypothetical protein [Verrucomicrobiota bacterium]